MSRAQGHTRATVFGLDVSADEDLSFLCGSKASQTGRTLEVSVAGRHEPPAGEWPDGAELLCDQRDADGAIAFQIESHPGAGYRIWGPVHGTHLLSPDGRLLESIPSDRCDGTDWQRLLIAQVLPFAATLHGLEVFHAGAVRLDGRAIALAGPSGSGKTSTVIELCRAGARFMADDALAVEHVGDRLLAHPGTALAGIDRGVAPRRDETTRMHPEESPQGNVIAADRRELMVRMTGVEQPAPLAAMFFLERHAEGPERPSFEPLEDAGVLLRATFNFVLASPDRLLRLLEVCALAAGGRVERVLFGPGADPSVVAAAVRERVSEKA